MRLVRAAVASSLFSAWQIRPTSLLLRMRSQSAISWMVSLVFPFLPMILERTSSRFFLLVRALIGIIRKIMSWFWSWRALSAEKPNAMASRTIEASYSSIPWPSMVASLLFIWIFTLRVFSSLDLCFFSSFGLGKFMVCILVVF